MTNVDLLRDRLLRLPPVRWLHPAQLVRIGAQVAQARMFGAFAARRENEAAQPAEMYDLSLPSRDMWIDYTADVGDGFDSTYAVARSIAADPLPDGETSGHGELLVLGGDETYPVASEDNYRARTMSVYRAALPDCGDDSPALLAIPGNHDWYDGLTAFLRVFCQGWLADVPLPVPRKGSIRMVDPDRRTSTFVGGWRTVQSRSYFAARLPHGWWLWGTDIQFDTYIDAPQLAYFIEAATHLGEDDNIILCTAKPSWAGAGDPETTERFVARTLGDRADAVRLICSGDRHHYSRYVPTGDSGPAALVTCGGGGAYLSPTHHLPDSTTFGRWPTDEAEFRRTKAFPDPAESRGLARRFWRLPLRNPALGALLGPVYAVLMWLLAATQPGDGALDRLLGYSLADTRLAPASLPALVGCLLVVAATLGIARPSSGARALAGLSHGAAHLGVLLGVAYAVAALSWPADAFAASVLITLVIAIVCGVVGAYVLATYFFCCQALSSMHSNELFAGLRVVDFKSYLRLQVTPEGVRVHPIGL
ncbi:MAG: hypothetical protein L0K86_19290, partial [Actinomycetia bacterium]|nr:hypothetical protein [Actinomycetes bacterium]